MLLKTHWYIWTALLHLFYVRAFNVLIQNVEFATLYLTCTNELAERTVLVDCIRISMSVLCAIFMESVRVRFKVEYRRFRYRLLQILNL